MAIFKPEKTLPFTWPHVPRAYLTKTKEHHISKRTSDTEAKTRYRSDRMIEQEGQWYFSTREGTIEGPFPGRVEAVNQLDRYIKVMQAELVSDIEGLSLEPQDSFSQDEKK